ncbi:MAG TPA: RDD family protein [Methylophilaceae bacterium]|nr:RDD family protein [Methylophilaceae bacterium]
MSSPGFFRLLASLFYDSLLVLALLIVATFLFVAVFGQATHPPLRYVLQFYLWCVAGVYFSWCWSRGRTLAMQAWKIRLINATGDFLSLRQAMQRYVFATAGLLCVGIGFWWALFDRDCRFLHDRVIGSRLVVQREAAD